MKALATVALAAGVLVVLALAVPWRGAPPVSRPAVQTWNFVPTADSFSPEAWLDLRSLNEPVAGQTGFVGIGADGGFVRGDGAPLRFWAVNTDVARSPFVAAPLGPKTAPDLARHARFLAKRGVNMVRLHRQLV